jgi:TRAP-type C4-dicarboxylate transport system substrate-binding protein
VPLVVATAGCLESGANKAGGQEEKPLVLTLANGNPGDVDVGEWVQAVERLSHGSIRIQIKSDWRQQELGGEAATVRDVRTGPVDLAKVPARAWHAAGMSGFDALLAPFLVTTYDLERRVVSGDLGKQMLSGVEHAGVVGLALLPGELQRPVGVTRDLVGPASYEGATIAAQSELAGTVMRALGARPRPTVERLDLAAFDGAEINLFSLEIDEYFRQAHSATTNVVLWPRAMTIVMNVDAYRRLTPGERAILREAGRAAVPEAMERLRSAERGALASVCRHRFRFVSASAADLAALRASVRPLYERLRRDAKTRELLDRIETVKGSVFSVEPVPSCSRGSGSLATVSPLDGTWHASATRAEFVAAHPLPQEFPDQNYGKYMLILRRGRFQLRNSRFAGEAGLGRFSVTGDVITFVPGGTAAQGAGETWKYRWNLYRVALVLRRTDTPGPTALVVKPWERVS